MKSLALLPVMALILITAAPVTVRAADPEPPSFRNDGQWREDREKMKSMSPQEREKFMAERQAARQAKIEEYINSLPPEEQGAARDKMGEMEARRSQLRQELMALPPEERRARMKELREERREMRGDRRTGSRRDDGGEDAE